MSDRDAQKEEIATVLTSLSWQETCDTKCDGDRYHLLQCQDFHTHAAALDHVLQHYRNIWKADTIEVVNPSACGSPSSSDGPCSPEPNSAVIKGKNHAMNKDKNEKVKAQQDENRRLRQIMDRSRPPPKASPAKPRYTRRDTSPQAEPRTRWSVGRTCWRSKPRHE